MALLRSIPLALLLVIIALSFQSGTAEARYFDSNVQCPPGGKIGQACKDNTNGYVTPGKCAYVYVCKATNVPSQTPPTCKAGSRDCPTGMPPPQYTSTKPTKIDPNAPQIPESRISEIEAGVLDKAFGGTETAPPSQEEMQDLSASANLELFAALGEGGEEEYLSYVPESFDSRTSTLFESLRNDAVALSPGQKPEAALKAIEQVRLAYSTGGFFGGNLAYEAELAAQNDASERIASLKLSIADQLWLFPRFLALAIFHTAKAIGFVFLADFGVASEHWAEARSDFTIAFSSLVLALQLLFKLLGQLIIAANQSLQERI